MAEGRLNLLREQPRLNPIASAGSGLEILPSGIWARIILRKRLSSPVFTIRKRILQSFEAEGFTVLLLANSISAKVD